MVDEPIAVIVRKYLNNLNQQGLPVAYGVVFGSQARVAAHTDSRIEPIPVGERQFLTDDSRAIIEIARREGQVIPLID